jgi:hypothetical protein
LEVLLLEPPWQEEAAVCASGWKHLLIEECVKVG